MTDSRFRAVVALMPPVAALLLQWYFWSYFQPYAWLLLYPGIFFSAWIGGARAGVVATLFSVTAAWWLFIEPRGSLVLAQPSELVSMLVFTAMGILLSVLHGRLSNALANSHASRVRAEQLAGQLDRRIQQRSELLQPADVAIPIREARFASVIESATDAIISMDCERRIVLFNAAAEAMFGCAAADALGLSIDKFIPERCHSLYAPYIHGAEHASGALQTGQSIELYGLGKDGAEFPVEASISKTYVGGQELITMILRDIARRRRMEQSLRDSEARFHGIFDGLLEGCQIIGFDYRYLYINASAAQQWSPDFADRLGRTMMEVLPGVETTEKFALLERCMRARVSERHETRVDLPDGSFTWLEVSMQPVPDGVLILTMDITRRRQMEESLRASEARFHDLFDGLLEGCQIIGFDWRYHYINAAAGRNSRTAPADRLGKTVMEVFPGVERTESFKMFERCMYERLPSRHESRIDYPDGSYTWFEVSIQPAPDGIFVLAMDITERKKAALEILQSSERLRQIADCMPQLIWTALPGGVCDFAGRRWSEYTGLPEAALLERGWLDLIHPEDQARLIEEWSAAGYQAEFRTEARLRRHDGAYRWFDIRATSLRDTDGKVLTWFCSNTDIDERRRAGELQLRSQKMEALGTLAGGIAHDFNNILLAIKGNTRLAIADLEATHPVQVSLGEIERASTRASELVRRILSFSRQEEPRREVVQLQPVIQEALDLLRATLPSMIQLHSRFEADVPATLADSSQVHQIIMNLATNSAHAIGARSGIIEFALDTVNVDVELARATPGLHEGQYARLTVCDNGSGMDRTTLDRIFDPFFTTKPVGQGTGLGLSMVDGIMKIHDGAITVYSQQGKGTSFRLYFPAARAGAQVTPERQAPLLKAQGQRVLYVDDDRALVFLAQRTLNRLGYSVTGCTNPCEALEKFRADPNAFDVVVTDMSMPLMSGTDLTREIRAIRADMPVVITSGYLRPEDQEIAMQLGAAALILKPNTIEELGELFDRLFKSGLTVH